jgi:methyltransferase (TIGR00027 family)
MAPIALRTRFFDDYLTRVTGRDAVRQVVLMASGLDARAFRLHWPEGTRLFELDQPGVLRHKEQVLRSAGARPACARVVIPVDLTGPWTETLFGAGFDPAQPSGWLLEGFLFYLPNERLEPLLDAVTDLAAPGSWVGFDIMNRAMLTSEWTEAWIAMQARHGAPWIGTMDDPAGFLAARGWGEVTVTFAGLPGANYGRWPYPVAPITAPDIPRDWLVTGRKTGYGEPT